ncbi:hypothetical protein [Methylobacterium sp. CM6244]
MAAPLQVRGSASAAYRAAFRAFGSLWRETAFVTFVLIVQLLLSNRMGGSGNATGSLSNVLLDIGVTILIVSYTMAIYRHALGLRSQSMWALLGEAIRRKDLLAYHLGWYLLGIPWAWGVAYLQSALGLLILPAIVIVSIWVTCRLFAVGPPLAIEGLEVTARDAFRATVGQVWTIFYIGFRAAIPLVAVALILGALIISTNGRTDPPVILSGTLVLLFGVIGVVLRAVLEAQIFRELGLFSSRREVE